MRKFKLVTTNNQLLYEGFHTTLKSAIEYAVMHNINLDGIDLSDTDLQHINLDGVRMNHVSFSGANLYGANMSEAEFQNCDFSYANLSYSCLCYSNINKCNFKYTIFTEVDISMASLVLCDFHGFSALNLDYHKAFKLESLTFTHFKKSVLFSMPPTLIKHGKRWAAVVDKTIFYNDIPHTLDHKITPESILDIVSSEIQSMVDC